MPGIAVDRKGRVAVCYYDRSLDAGVHPVDVDVARDVLHEEELRIMPLFRRSRAARSACLTINKHELMFHA